jgi:hypothetical protein
MCVRFWDPGHGTLEDLTEPGLLLAKGHEFPFGQGLGENRGWRAPFCNA